MTDLLIAHKLVKIFDEILAVDALTLTVQKGEIVGLLGPNGAGKTTTLRMLAGILSPESGTVRIDGIDLRQRPLEAKRKIGFLSGDTQLYQRLDTREVLRYFGRLYMMPDAEIKRRTEELVRDLEMADFADRPTGTLSAGQKQRANIARAFLHDPALLILDEPTNALDVMSGRFIVESIRAQKRAGKAILFSTHIMSEAEYLCDRIALMYAGKIIDLGTVPELLERAGADNLTDAFFHHVEREGAARA